MSSINETARPDDEADSVCLYSIVTRHNTSLQLLQAFVPGTVLLSRLLLPLWVAVGVPGSLASLLVWSSRRLRSASSIYLCALAALDAAFLLLQQLPWHLHTLYGLRVVDNPVMCTAFPVFSLWLQYVAPLLILAFTVERYVAIFHPFRSRRSCTPSRSLVTAISLALACFPLALVQLSFFRYDKIRQQCLDDERVFRAGTPRYRLYHAWTKTTEVLFFAATPLAILLFNCLVLSRARRSSESRGRRRATTATLLCVSFYQIGVMLPVSIMMFTGYNAISVDLNAATCNLTDAEVVAGMSDGRLPEVAGFFRHATASSLVSLLAVSHNACKLFIYLATGKAFRRQLLRMLGCRRCRYAGSGGGGGGGGAATAAASSSGNAVVMMPMRGASRRRQSSRQPISTIPPAPPPLHRRTAQQRRRARNGSCATAK